MTLRGIAIGSMMLLGLVGATCAQAPNDDQRAGFPLETSRWAKPSDTGRYTGYQVGGGARMRKGEPPLAQEGTWGWDYEGGLFRRRVINNWWHGRRYQGGSGAYRTDGPKVLRE